jgi:general nucleoside transport system permease protein
LENLLTMTFFTGLMTAGIRSATPILFTALGEIYAERSGVYNIGLEGIMLCGALAGFMASFYTQSAGIGVMVGAIAGGALSLVHAFACIFLFVDQIVSGLAINIFALGLTSYIFKFFAGKGTLPPRIAGLGVIEIPLLSKLPMLGKIVFSHNALVYVAFALVPISWWVIFRTTLGLHLRATGENPEAVETAGLHVKRIRFLCVFVGGLFAGLGGAYMSIAQLTVFTENMIGGRGFIALAAVIFGKWNPLGAMGGALLFGLADAAQLRLQALGFRIPNEFFLMLPYVLTIVVLTKIVGRTNPPAALGVAYRK